MILDKAISLVSELPIKKIRPHKTKQRLVAVSYDKRGRIIAHRSNSYKKTHPLQSYFATKVGNPEAIYLHAEIATMIASTPKDIHGLMVIRMDAHGNLANAKPCNICKEAFKHFNINEVKYSDSNGRIKYL